MSTRVQKGGTVFRPVARPQRARPGSESRQTSAVPEIQPSLAHTRIEGTPASTQLSDMPPPTHIPSKPVSDLSPQTIDPSRRVTPALSVNSSNNQERNVPLSSAGVSGLAGTSRSASWPAGSRSDEDADAARPPQPSNGGIALTIPSRAVPVVVSQRGPLVVDSVPTPAGERETKRSQNAPQRAHPTVTADGAAHVPMPSMTPNGPFDMSQIDPSLQPTLTTFPSHAFAPPSFVERSSRTFDSVPSDTSTSQSQALENQTPDEMSATDHCADSAQVRVKRRRAKSSQGAATAPEGRAQKRKSKGKEHVGEGDEHSAGIEGQQRRGKSRAPSVTPFDPDADPGEDLDPTTITMSSLCDDTGQGRVSSKAAQVISNHAAWRVASREKRARIRAMAEAKKYGRNIDDEDQQPTLTGGDAPASLQTDAPTSRSPSVAPGDPQAGPSTSGSDRLAEVGQTGDDFDYSQNLATSRYNVQVRIGANGETIIDEESLFVSRDEEEDTQNYTHVEESDTTKFVNSLTYSKKPRGSRWSAEETELFYDALSQFGENYELISYILPGRDRKACKNKFKAEDKKNPARVNASLNNRKPFDIQTLARMTGKDFSGPTPEIRAPAPLQSTELDANVTTQPEADTAPKVKRKKSRTPAAIDGEEILGSIEDIEKDDSLFGGDDITV
ncbi:hypothetical protein DAEQUDRAFT_701193 [Daedalea quercina L-15889]|uniref:Myb-like domain-containing protein n=1 Tax=Daedalea quercina L-15889 TaxID=1314783 RepID=A0A165UJE4_9APHY|nr:hypothetical protein DAEQUDRAFT_701193 [Daedalea quercina L-15889]